MRRPTQHHTTPAIRSAWVHPYTGTAGLGVFYNDGGTPPATPPAQVPTPGDLAALSSPPPSTASQAGPERLIDRDTGLPMTQARFSKIMTRENTKGRNSAFRELAEAAGIPFDPDNFDASKFGDMFKQAEQARQAQLSEEQKRAEDLARREKEFEERVAATAAREAEVAQRDRQSLMQAALVRLGATDEDLTDATELLKARIADGSDSAAITAAAEKLKEQRPGFFGGTAQTSTLPPAPGGAPAGGPPPRTPAGGKDAINEAARKRAEAMGLRTKPEAA